MKPTTSWPTGGRAAGVAATVVAHGILVVVAWFGGPWGHLSLPKRAPSPTTVTVMEVTLVASSDLRALAPEPEAMKLPVETKQIPLPVPEPLPIPPVPARALAQQPAPAPPSAADWDLAARYTARNSKAYRYAWGQQVRSQMGTAVEGPDQGSVRFRIEIAPEGRVVRVDTLWSTSALAEARARQAIAALPALPPTPNGRPLVFERTVHFSPFAHDDPPHYQGDCEPEPPVFRNPFAWDAKGDARYRPPEPARVMTEEERDDCLRNRPLESIDAALARDRRALDRWGWKDALPSTNE